MGTAFGSIKDKCVDYELLYHSNKYEVRKYAPMFVAEIECDDQHYKSAILTMQRYLGTVGVPENVKGSSKEDSTEENDPTPVAIPTTLPASRYNNKLQFILPSEYTSIDEVPVPKEKSITIKAMPSRTVGVYSFTGRAPRDIYTKHLAQLSELLTTDNLLSPVGTETPVPENESGINEEERAERVWSVAKYHPHSNTTTSSLLLPIFRKNEVWIELEEAAVNAFLAQRHHEHTLRENVTAIAPASAPASESAPAPVPAPVPETAEIAHSESAESAESK